MAEKKGLFNRWRHRLGRQLLELEEESVADLEYMDELREENANDELAKAQRGFGLQPPYGVEDEATEAANRPRQKYKYRRASLVDPSLSPALGEAGYGIYRPRYSHITNKTLKEMSLRDPIVAAIMQTRINQIARFSKPQASRFDPGFKISPVDPNMEIGAEEEEEVLFLESYICNTGSNTDRDPDSMMDFDMWLKLVIRDRLTFGAVAIETIRDNLGRIHSFVPAPTESIYYANKQLSPELVDQVVQANQMAYKQAVASGEEEKMEAADNERDRNRTDEEDYEFVQVLNGRVHQGFTRQEMVYKLGNPQNFITNNGYCIGELEFSTLSVTAHLQAENYNKLFFTHGFASRGLIHIKGDATPAMLKAFRSQWYAQISGNSNSWRTPILAGVDDVQWIPLSASNRDMEYKEYVDHIIRTLCALFAISPIEIGFDYLTKGPSQGGIGTEDNDSKLQQSQVRGLAPLLSWIESIINEDILPNLDEELSEKYKFEFVGLESESKMEELARQEQEATVRATMNEIREESGLDPVLAGEVVSNPLWIQLLMQTHTIGQIREYLFGYSGDSDNPKYDYIESPSWFQQRNIVDPGMQQLMGMPGDEFGGGGGQFGEEGEEGEEVPPGEEEEMTPEEAQQLEQGMAPEEQQQLLMQSRRENLDLIKFEMSAKSQWYKGVRLDKRLEKVKKQYIRDYKKIEKLLMKEIFEIVKGDVGDED